MKPEAYLEPNQRSTTAQKMKFSIKDLFSKCDQIRNFLRIWSHLLKKSLMENFIFCAVYDRTFLRKKSYSLLPHSTHCSLHLFSISFHFFIVQYWILFYFYIYQAHQLNLKRWGGRQSEGRRAQVRSTNSLNFSPIMVGGGEEHFAILEALKRLFQHFLQHSLHIAV